MYTGDLKDRFARSRDIACQTWGPKWFGLTEGPALDSFADLYAYLTCLPRSITVEGLAGQGFTHAMVLIVPCDPRQGRSRRFLEHTLSSYLHEKHLEMPCRFQVMGIDGQGDVFITEMEQSLQAAIHWAGLEPRMQAASVEAWYLDIQADRLARRDDYSLYPLRPELAALSQESAQASFAYLAALAVLAMTTQGVERTQIDERITRASKGFISVRKTRDRGLYSQGRLAFQAWLDPSILSKLQQVSTARVDYYSYFNAGGDPQVRLRRRQASDSYPLLTPLFVSAGRNGLGRAVDEAMPLIPSLRKTLSASRRDIAFLNGLHWQRTGIHYARDIRLLLAHIHGIPNEYLPRSRADWKAFRFHITVLRQLASSTGAPLLSLIQPFGQGWDAGERTLAERYGRSAIANLGDFFTFLLKAIYHHLLPPGYAVMGHGVCFKGRDRQILTALFGGRCLNQLLSLSERWHFVHQRLLDEALVELKKREAAIDVPRWMALIDQPVWYGPYQVVSLTDALELTAEGSKLNHCVGSYSAACLLHHTHILSIRNQDGISLSTLELRAQREGDGYTLCEVQHNAWENSEPSPALQAVAHQFVNECNQGRLASNITEAFARCEHHQLMKGCLPGHHRDFALNLQVDYLGEAFFEYFAFCFPAKARRQGIKPYLAALMDALEIDSEPLHPDAEDRPVSVFRELTCLREEALEAYY